MCIQTRRQTHLPHFPGQAEGNREYGHLCSSDPGSCGPTSYPAQPHTQVSYPYTTHRCAQSTSTGYIVGLWETGTHSQCIVRKGGAGSRNTPHTCSCLWNSHQREGDMYFLFRDTLNGGTGGEILCTYHSFSVPPAKAISHTTQPSACFKMCRRNTGGQQPKNYSETSGHPLTIAWNRLIFPISYSNYNSFPHCHLQCSLQLEDCSAKARPSSSLPKSFVMEMSFGI